MERPSETPDPYALDDGCLCGHTFEQHDDGESCTVPGCYCSLFNDGEDE